MINEQQRAKMKKLFNDSVLFDEDLSAHSTIRIGGKADAFALPRDKEEVVALLKFAKDENLNTFVLGVGSNVLFRDHGFDGIVINTVNMRTILVKEKTGDTLTLEASAGVLINDLIAFAVNEEMAGFESLAGIPGTVGGALSMNAGTHDGTVSDSLVSIDAIDKAGRTYNWSKDKIEFSYRKARFPKACVITSAEFCLKKGAKEIIEKKINELRERRRERHPLSLPSLGSIFKNPPKPPSVGQLIEEAGLKGVRVGGARVSEKHGNWIVNEGGATAKDVEVLVHLVREKIKESAEILLETEICVVGKK